MKKSVQNVPILDVYHASFLILKGIPPNVVAQGNRIVFEFPMNTDVCRLSKEYQNNCAVPILDFVTTIRQLRAKMIAMKGGLTK